jgi:uncharacterized protein (TIGR01777 family)
MKGPKDKPPRPFAASQPPLSRSDELRITSTLSKICVMGATGFLGRALCAALERSGATVHRYSRSARPGFASWDPASGEIESEPLEAADAVVNLAGEDIAGGRWTAQRKKILRDSRVGSTQLLVQTLGKLKQPPKVLINASAVGFYGHRGQDAVAENSPVGTGFLAELCQQWEAAAMQASAHGVRVVIPRLGIVLSKDGGALARMLPTFKLGVAGRLGSGQQFMSWISLLDAVSVIRFLMSATEITGVVNAVAPEPVTNEAFTEVLGRIVRRPTLLPVPVFALKAALGELSQVLLEGANVRPRVLEHAGFRFDYPRLEDALEAVLA